MKKLNTDLGGTSGNNKFTETFTVNAQHPNQIYILQHSPFFGGLVLKKSGESAPLALGGDYELVYRIEEYKGAANGDVYNGIKLLKHFDGDIVAEGQTVGGGFYNDINTAVNALLKYINTPLETSYNNVEERPPLFPPKPTYRPWFNITNKQYLASAVEDTRDAVESSSGDMSNTIDLLIARTRQLKQTMVALNVPGHIAAKNPHDVTLNQLNAHQANLPVVDTAAAYGHDLQELVRLIRSSGLAEADINKYIHRYGSEGIQGAFDFADGKASILSEDGRSSIRLNNGILDIKTDGVLTFRAGRTKTQGKFLEIKAGVNTLRIESTGNVLNDSKVTLNGHPFITTDNVFEYDPENEDAQEETVDIQHSGVNVTPSGRGSPNNPLKADFTPPAATTSVAGGVRARGTHNNPHGNDAVASNVRIDPPNTLIPKSWRVSGQPIGNGITINATTIGLERVNNTRDVNKPISDPQKAEIDSLANLNHKHPVSIVQKTPAEVNVLGVARIANNAAEFNALLQEIATVPADPDGDDYDYDGDIPSRLFGISHAYYVALRSRFYNNLPDISDVFDTRELSVSAISGATFTISGSVLTAQPGNFYIAPTAQAGLGGVVGTIHGGVNLANVSTEQWISGSCGIDYNFPLGVWVGSPIGGRSDFIEVSGTRASKSGIKYRIPTDDGKLRFNIAAAGVEANALSVYLNGKKINTDGQNTYTGEVAVSKGINVVAIEVKTSTTVSAIPALAASIEVVDLGVVVDTYNTGPSTQFGYIPDTMPFESGRYYLYVNTTSGNVFATIGTFDYMDISTQFVYVGKVDVIDGTVVTPDGKLTYQGVIDFGMFRELVEHDIDLDAHTGSEIRPTGLEQMAPHGMVDANTVRNGPNYTRVYDTALGQHPIHSRDTAARWCYHPPGTNHTIGLLCEVPEKSPYQFKSYNNPRNPDGLAYEGAIQYFNDRDINEVNRVLVFTKKTENVRNGLFIDLNKVRSLDGSAVTIHSDAISSLGLPIDNDRSVISSNITRVSTTATDDWPWAVLGFSGAGFTENYVEALTYRYTPRTNTLRVAVLFKAEYQYTNMAMVAPRSSFEVFNIVPSGDLRPYFGSDEVGVYITGPAVSSESREIHFGMAGTPFPIPASVDYRDVIDYDELFKSYISAGAVSEYASLNNGMSYGRFNASLHSVNERFPGSTGFYGETEIGAAVCSVELPYPVCMIPDTMKYPGLKYPLSIHTEGSLRTQRLNQRNFRMVGGMSVGTNGHVKTGIGSSDLNIPAKIRVIKATDSVLSNTPSSPGWSIFKNKGISFKARSVALKRHLKDTYVDKEVGIATKTDLVPVTAENMTRSPRYKNGYVEVVFTNEDAAEFVYAMDVGDAQAMQPEFCILEPQARGVAYYTPWHITQRTWEWYCAVGKNKAT